MSQRYVSNKIFEVTKNIKLKSIVLQFEDDILEPITMDFSKAPDNNIHILLAVLNVFKEIKE